MPDRDFIAEGRRLLTEAGPYPWIVGGPSPSGVHYVGCVVAEDEPPELLGEIAYAEHVVHIHNTYSQLLDKLETALIRVNQLEGDALLASACRPPEIRDRPSDADLSRLVRALEGTGDPLHVLGTELLELRGDQNAGLVLAREAAELKAEHLKMGLDERELALDGVSKRLAELEGVREQAVTYGREAKHQYAQCMKLQDELAEARRIHDESPGECYHCPRCQDAEESEQDSDEFRCGLDPDDIIDPQARQFVGDVAAADRMRRTDLVIRYAHALSTVRVLWASRRALQDRGAELEEQLKPFGPNPERLAESFRRIDRIVDRTRKWGDEQRAGVTEKTSPETASLLVCSPTCNDCRADEHRDPPEWHTWADDEDIAHATAIGGSDPTKSRCGCVCAKSEPAEMSSHG